MLSSFRFVFLILLFIVVNNNGALGRQKKWPDRLFLQDSERLEVNLFNIVKGVRRENDRCFVISSAIKDVRGGEDISSFANTTLLVGSIDQLARSTSLFLGWVVAFQAFVSGISTHRDSLLEVVERVVGKDTVRATRAIRKILSSVEDHGIVNIFSRHDARQVVISMYALTRLQAACQRHERILDGKISGPTAYPDQALLKDLCETAPFATAAYGWKLDLATAGRLHRGDLRALVKMTGIDPSDVVIVNWDARPTRPAFFIARDRKRKRIVCSIRGTWSAQDVLTDLWCTPEDYEVCSSSRRRGATKMYRAHNGMLEAAKGLASCAEEIIEKELQANPDYELVLVGHSLGGSVAAILGTLWADKFGFVNISVFAFGAACVFPLDDSSRELEEKGLRIFTVLLDGDPFSSLSLGHVAEVIFALDYLCQDPELRSTVLMRTDGTTEQLDERDLEWCSQRMEEIRDKAATEKLFPPGRLIFLPYKKKGHDKRKIREVSPAFFQYWVPGFDLSRHVPRLYEAKLKQALAASYRHPK